MKWTWFQNLHSKPTHYKITKIFGLLESEFRILVSGGLKLCSKIESSTASGQKKVRLGALLKQEWFGNRDLVRDSSKDPYPSYLPRWEKWEDHCKINFVLICLDPPRWIQMPNYWIIELRVRGTGLTFQLFSVRNGSPTNGMPMSVFKGALYPLTWRLKILTIHLQNLWNHTGR